MPVMSSRSKMDLMGTKIPASADSDPSAQQAVETLLRTARSSGVTLCVAESCTGGLLAALVTEAPGASQVFQGGVVAYSNRLKIDVLGVDQTLLSTHGSVSPEVAKAMALGSLCLCTADVALSITGIAGPTGGLPDKPVGLVWYGIAIRTSDAIDTFTESRHFDGDRVSVRHAAALHGLRLLQDAVAPCEGT